MTVSVVGEGFDPHRSADDYFVEMQKSDTQMHRVRCQAAALCSATSLK